MDHNNSLAAEEHFVGTLDSVHVGHTCLADFQAVAGTQSPVAFHDKPAVDLVDIVGRKASTVDSCLVDIGLKKRKNQYSFPPYTFLRSNIPCGGG